MEEELLQLLKTWKEIHQLTLDLLDCLTEEQLSFKVGNNMGSLGKQYRHLGDVQICYNEAIKNKKIDFDNYKRDYSLESSKEKLKSFLQGVNQETINLLENHSDAKINWFGEEWNLKKHLRALIDHEILHQGELIVYIRSLGIEFPKSWRELWGL